MPDMKTPGYAKAGLVNFEDIPVIDLSAIDTEQGRTQIAAELVHTAKTIGFFYISNHGIAAEICAKAFTASRRFFALPVSDKTSIEVNQHQRGWMAQGMANLEGSKTYDAKEVFFWGLDVTDDDPDVIAGLQMVHPNQWPDHVAPFLRRDIMPYYNAVLDLSRKILAALAIGLGQSADMFHAAYQKPLGRGQLVYYPTLNKTDIDAERFGAAAHSDFGVLTILMQDNLGGLQVQRRDGEWIEATPIDGTLVCNIGDLLERWTNGMLISTKHRVLNRSSQNRFSIPIFCDPASDAIIDPRDFDPDADIGTYPPISAGDYIMGRNQRNFAQYEATDGTDTK
ncbi:MAG: isopenicillin N synthase family oxygenase [Candidatus Puniceispirillum sp.]|nr:isopenicillin N synthase family oxygenase [Candidatus Puniceispirillum sp.]